MRLTNWEESWHFFPKKIDSVNQKKGYDVIHNPFYDSKFNIQSSAILNISIDGRYYPCYKVKSQLFEKEIVFLRIISKISPK